MSGHGVVKDRVIRYGASYKSTTNINNSNEAVFAPASNINGAIVHMMRACSSVAAVGAMAYVAKTSAPANVNDGDVLCTDDNTTNPGGTFFFNMKSEQEFFVPAGKGLYYVNSMNEANAHRSVLYTLL